MLGYSIDTFPEGFAKGDLQNALDAMDWGAQCESTHRLPQNPVTSDTINGIALTSL